MFNRIQNIYSISGNDNIIINGDVVIDKDVPVKIAAQLLKPELDILTLEAREEFWALVNKCVEDIIGKIVEKKLEEKIAEFAKPSTQFAFYTTLKGYAAVETVEQREMLVDSFIERTQESWDSAEKMIIDSALEILPRLTPRMLSTLGLLQLRHQITNASISFMLNQYFTNLTPLVEQMADIDGLEMEYLKQEQLVLPLPGLQSIVPFEKYMLSQYDLFFRHPLPDGVYENYCKANPQAHEAVSDVPIRACMMWVDGTKDNVSSFCCANSNMLKETLRRRHQDYIIPHVDTLMGMMPAFTEDEVREYFKALSPSWERLLSMFSSETFTHYILSITGKYLGGKVLAKVSRSKPLPLSGYKNLI